MQTISCPSCGANVNFVSKASIFAVCSYCKSSLVRQNMNLEVVGKISELRDDLTPIQIGTSGMFDGKKFEVIGRMRIGWADGYWNEWYSLYDGSKESWLVEAQGFLALCFPYDETPMPTKGVVSPGRNVHFGKHGYFQVEDMREVECIYSEGELPVNGPQGRISVSVDLTEEGGSDMATIEYADNETRVFVGKYKDFDEFQFKNLREIDGWKL